MTSWPTIIAVASGGALGAVARLLINGWVSRITDGALPYGTLAVNLLGSLLIGMLFAWFHTSTPLSPQLKSLIVTGFLGAMTTYSTFAIESFFLLEAGDYAQAFANITLNLFGTILLAGAGYVSVIYYVES
jgi:fluoride exporter